jgi:MFS family permease
MVYKEAASEEHLKSKAREISIREGSAYSISDGFGIRNITPYAISIGANNLIIGFLSSLPGLIGNFCQIFSSRLMEKHPRKKIVFWTVLIQAFLWLLVIIPGIVYFLLNIRSNLPPILLVIIYTALVIAGALPGPAWSSWMNDIVPEKARVKYFGDRNKICGTISLSCALLAGFILDYFKGTRIFLAFALFFFLSFIGRSISAYMFTKQYEPPFRANEGYHFSFTQFLSKMFYNNFGRFVIFISFITFSSAIASPFFAVYLLRNLGLNSAPMGYLFYFIITIAAAVTSILFMPVWGRFSDKYGNLRTMKLTGIFIPLIPLMYFISYFIPSFVGKIIFLIILEAMSGIIWAGFNLAAGNFIYDTVSRQRLGLCVAYFNMLNGIGNFLGAMFGGLLSFLNLNFLGLSSILVVFLISAFLRLALFLFISPRVKEVRDVPNFDIGDDFRKRFKFFPNLGIFDFLSEKSAKPRHL